MKTRLKVVVAAVLALAGHGAFAADAEAEKKAAVERALALIQSNPASFSVATPAPVPSAPVGGLAGLGKQQHGASHAGR
jgi:hypothetical protein